MCGHNNFVVINFIFSKDFLKFFSKKILLGEMPTKVWFVKIIHNKIQTYKRKTHWKGVRQTTRYNSTKTLKGCKTNNQNTNNQNK